GHLYSLELIGARRRSWRPAVGGSARSGDLRRARSSTAALLQSKRLPPELALWRLFEDNAVEVIDIGCVARRGVNAALQNWNVFVIFLVLIGLLDRKRLAKLRAVHVRFLDGVVVVRVKDQRAGLDPPFLLHVTDLEVVAGKFDRDDFFRWIGFNRFDMKL